MRKFKAVIFAIIILLGVYFSWWGAFITLDKFLPWEWAAILVTVIWFPFVKFIYDSAEKYFR